MGVVTDFRDVSGQKRNPQGSVQRRFGPQDGEFSSSAVPQMWMKYQGVEGATVTYVMDLQGITNPWFFLLDGLFFIIFHMIFLIFYHCFRVLNARTSGLPSILFFAPADGTWWNLFDSILYIPLSRFLPPPQDVQIQTRLWLLWIFRKDGVKGEKAMVCGG